MISGRNFDLKGTIKNTKTNKGRKKCILCTWGRAGRQLHAQRFPNSCEEEESGIDTKCAADFFERKEDREQGKIFSGIFARTETRKYNNERRTKMC